MKFGKHILAHQVPGWSANYLDYKFLKKIISSLVANRPAPEAGAPFFPPDPNVASALPEQRDSRLPTPALDDDPGRPPLFPTSVQDGGRGPSFQAHKAAFFFKLERELEKINAFYLQKEAELKLRMETLLSKRRAAALRGLPDTNGDATQMHAEWSAVEEGFRLLERDLGKLQQYIEMNALGVRKILKKYDKRSMSTTKELYLARQVDVQPVFNRQLISELADTVATCLLDVTDLSSGHKFEGSATNALFTEQIFIKHNALVQTGPFIDLENNFHKAIAAQDKTAIMNCVNHSDILAQQVGGKANVTRILLNVIIESPPDIAETITSSLTSPFDYQFIDDINGRTCLHEASIAGCSRLVNACIANGVPVDKIDVYGRTALHYACMNGHQEVAKRLLEASASPNVVDRDNYSPLIYATLKGNVGCARVLLEEGHVPVQSTIQSDDVIPLSLACQSGHVEVVLLLLQMGAQCLANSNGEYPMHLAARQGHSEICSLLLHREGWDTPDKYHIWTPLFHAARYGRDKCVQVLLDAGCRTLLRDELGHSATHYAAWYGHQRCLSLLLDASRNVTGCTMLSTLPKESPMSDAIIGGMSEIDLIPSLSLPPPIMPHRVYGHNYLDKCHLVQVSVGRPARGFSETPGVRLYHRLISPAFKDEFLLAAASLKLVMTTSTLVNSAPYSISLPQKDENGVFVFQISSLSDLTLEFSIYPSFGTKTIGRAVALHSLFSAIEDSQQFTLPILDNRLHVVGEVDFEVSIITYFRSVALEVDGGFETYWKSTVSPSDPLGSLDFSCEDTFPSVEGPVHTFPTVHSVTRCDEEASTISSLQGKYIYVVVQVTRDLHAVVYDDWLLPGTKFNLGIADVTLAQFEALANQLDRNIDDNKLRSDTSDWPARISQSMSSLDHLLKILEQDVNLILELAYPSRGTCSELGLGRSHNLNAFVDVVLHTIYTAAASGQRRKIVLASFSPYVSAALNWKQPNYPVFFAARCGRRNAPLPSGTAQGSDIDDLRVSSLSGAVDFAKANNLLGIFVDIELLTQVPSLVQGIKSTGLLVGVYAPSSTHWELATVSDYDGLPINALITERILMFGNHLLEQG